MTEPQEVLSPQAMDEILRDLVPMAVKTKGVAEYSFSELQKIASFIHGLQLTMASMDESYQRMELRLTELESRLQVVSSRVKGESGE